MRETGETRGGQVDQSREADTGLADLTSGYVRDMGHLARIESGLRDQRDAFQASLDMTQNDLAMAVDGMSVREKLALEKIAEFVRAHSELSDEAVARAYLEWMGLKYPQKYSGEAGQVMLSRILNNLNTLRSAKPGSKIFIFRNDSTNRVTVIQLDDDPIERQIIPSREAFIVKAGGAYLEDEGTLAPAFEDVAHNTYIEESEAYPIIQREIEKLKPLRELGWIDAEILLGLHQALSVYEGRDDFPDAAHLRSKLNHIIHHTVVNQIRIHNDIDTIIFRAIVDDASRGVIAIALRNSQINARTMVAFARNSGIHTPSSSRNTQHPNIFADADSLRSLLALAEYADQAEERQRAHIETATQHINAVFRLAKSKAFNAAELDHHLQEIASILDEYLAQDVRGQIIGDVVVTLSELKRDTNCPLEVVNQLSSLIGQYTTALVAAPNYHNQT